MLNSPIIARAMEATRPLSPASVRKAGRWMATKPQTKNPEMSSR